MTSTVKAYKNQGLAEMPAPGSLYKVHFFELVFYKKGCYNIKLSLVPYSDNGEFTNLFWRGIGHGNAACYGGWCFHWRPPTAGKISETEWMVSDALH